MSPNTKISIIYPMDPLSPKAGGIQAAILDFIRFAPADLDISLVGLTTNKAVPVKKWQKLNAGPKDFYFFPLMLEEDVDQKKTIPLSLRFVLSLAISRIDFSNQVLFFHRLEPALLFQGQKIRKILMVHNDIEEQIFGNNSEVFWSKIPFVYFLMEKLIFRSLRHIYTVTEKTTQFYRKRYPALAEKFSFLPVWADPKKFSISHDSKPILRERLGARHNGLDRKNKWILFAGRLQSQKAPSKLIDVFSEYHKINPSSCLIIAGEGNARPAMEQNIHKRKLANAVFFLGTLPQEDLIDFYRASDVLLLVSFFEGMPRCILEALDCGLPVVATDVGEVRRVVKNGLSGEVARDISAESLVSGLEKVLNSPANYTKENCAEAVKEFTPEHVLKPVYELLRSR